MSNTEIEKHYFKKFSKIYSLPEGRITYSDKPDVILTSPEGQKIGIEITNFYRRSGDDLQSEQRQRPLREQVIKKAQELYVKKTSKNVEFSFGFNPSSPITKKTKKELSQKISKRLVSINPQKSGSISPKSFDDIPELRFVYFNSELYENPEWKLVECHSEKKLNKERLEETIKKKENSIKNYAQCDSYCLLVVVDFIDLAQDQCLPENLEISNSNQFEKIIILRTGYDEYVEV